MSLDLLFVYRQPGNGKYSIEAVFDAISSDFKVDYRIEKYYLSSRRRLFLDLWNMYRKKPNVFLMTGDSNYVVPFLSLFAPVILVIHDIGHYHYTLRGIRKIVYGFLWFRLPILRAYKIVCISENTHSMLVNSFRVNSAKCIVISNPVRSEFFGIEKKLSCPECPVVLQVGTASYKNVETVIKSLKGFKCIFYIVGKLSFEQIELLYDCNVNYRNFYQIDFQEMLKLYKDADIVTFLSLGEGFGLPIIEAQAACRPILTSNIEPMCQIAGEGACILPPLDIELIRAELNKLVIDNDYRISIIDKGFSNAKNFSTPIITNHYKDIYIKIRN